MNTQPTNPGNQHADAAPMGEWMSSPVRLFHNRTAPEYMERRWLRSAAARADYAQTRRVLLEELRPVTADRILEIGSGPGTWTREVGALAGSTVSVDISEHMLAEAKRYTAGLPVEFIYSDFLSAPCSGPFTKIFSARAIEYIEDQEALAAKIAGLLAPGGTVVLITKTQMSLWRGRMRLLYRRGKRSAQRDGPSRPADEVDLPVVRQFLSSPRRLAQLFGPYQMTLVSVRPLATRPPVFRGGFHEFPLIPERAATPFLKVFGWLNGAVSRPSLWWAWLPLLLSESYSITLRHQPTAGGEK